MHKRSRVWVAVLATLFLGLLAACAPARPSPTPQIVIVTVTPQPTAVPTPPPSSTPVPVVTTAVPTPLPSPTPSPKPTEVPSEGPGTVVPPTPVPPTPEPSVSPVICDTVPIRGFGKVWAEHPEVPQGLGCPADYYYCAGGTCSGEQPMVSAVERFEHGTMIWVNRPTWEGSRWVYVLFDDGTYQRFPDAFVEGVDPESDPTIVPPAGLYQPTRGFGKVWREGTGAQVRERLGWAIEPEQGGDGAWQDFWRGSMYWIGPLDRIYVIYEYDVDYDPVHNYQEFKDTF